MSASTEPPKYFHFESENGGLDYRIASLGHPISLKTEYPKSSLRKYEIKLRKGRDPVMKSTSFVMPEVCPTLTHIPERIRRGVSQHGLFDLMHDAIRMGIVTHAELIGMIIGKTYGGTVLDDVTSKYLDGLAGGRGSKNLSLSGERS